MIALRCFIVALIATMSLSSVASPTLSRFVFKQVHFGNIPVEICLYASSVKKAEDAAAAAFERVIELSEMMSDYAVAPASPLNRIAVAAPAAVEVPPELFVALTRSVAMHKITQGAFDVTAKPFVQLWRTSRRVGELPPPERLRSAQRYVNIKQLKLDVTNSTAALGVPGMWLDLGGIAKGMIGDEVVRLLKSRGIRRCRYRAGGDMVFGDAPPGQDGWLVTVPDLVVDSLDGAARPLSFSIHNGAASVSGDVYRYVEIDGIRYSHVIDPRSGEGVTDRRVACVRGRRGIDTDPLATAGLILDEEQWRKALAQVVGCRGDVAQGKR